MNLIWQSNKKKNNNENIADNRGIMAAYYAYLELTKSRDYKDQCLPGLKQTPQQLFWISTASSFCSKYAKDDTSRGEDEHSSNEVRINKSFSNSKEFARDFNCRYGTKMNPNEKCIL